LPATDFLGALTTYLEGNSALAAEFGSEIYTGDVPPDPTYPYLSLEDYREMLPGETLEDEPVTFCLCVFAATLDGARAAAAVVKTQVDSPAINSSSTRSALAWTGGNEVMVWRNPSSPRRTRKPRGDGPVYCEKIEYEIWITPNQ